ncbi:Bor/Iss family lipoprotein [Buttiauxella noackiae]|uniref:Bor/Iss family lipoprotein n=1 Tax=Buttiauxella noackiae TaxID=82992 RepID=UPI003CC90C06
MTAKCVCNLNLQSDYKTQITTEMKVAKVEVKQSVLNVLVSTLTMGSYSPREANIYCLN